MTTQKPKTCHQVIPAGDSFHVIEPVTDINGAVDDISFTRIIAWVVCYEIDSDGNVESTWAVPVTPEFLPSEYAIFTPDGAYLFPDDCMFTGEDKKQQTIEHLNKYHKLRK